MEKNQSHNKKEDNNDLHSFVDKIEQNRELIRIKKPVDTKFELAAIVSKLEGREAVIFENVINSKIKVISNVIGTRKRFALALEAKNDKLIHDKILESRDRSKPPKIISDNHDFYNNTSKTLDILPIITHFEKDAGPFITSSVVYAKDQEIGYQNSSTHRLLRIDEKHMAIRMVEGRHLHKCFTYAKEHGEDLKIAVMIGVHPAINIAAAYQATYGFDEMQIANSLLNEKLTLVKNGYSQLLVPSNGEILLEGKILHDQTHEEWMVEMLKTYDFNRKQPVFELERIGFRNDALYYDILPGYSEHRLLMGLPVEAKMFESIRNVVPTTSNVYLTSGGSTWMNAVIQIRKKLEGEPKNAILAAFASHPSLKIVTVVDDDIDPTDPEEVEYAISTRMQADKDLIIISNVKGSSLDPSSDQKNLLTTKVGFDATATLFKPKERFEIAKIPGEDKIQISDYM